MARANSRRSRKSSAARPRRGARGAPSAPRPGRSAGIGATAIREAFDVGPVAGAIVLRGRILRANQAFARALGREPGEVEGRRLADLLPPVEGRLPEPDAGAVRSYRTSVEGIAARVDLAGAPRPRGGGAVLVSAVLTLVQSDADEAADRALLDLSRALAESRSEEDVTGALSRALEVLFPGRSFAIRLVDPATLALRTLYARGRLRSRAPARLTLRRSAVERTGLARVDLEEGGVQLVDEDEPLFAGCAAAVAVPLAVGGRLFGIVNLEYPHDGPGDRLSDAPLLHQLANHAALGVRNVRSFEELNYLKTYLESLIENANAIIFVVNRCREVTVWNDALAKLTGVPREDAVGDDLLAFVPADERSSLEAVLLRGFDGEAVAGYETRLLRSGSGEVRVAVNTAPILAAGGVEGVVAIGQDLTLLRSLQAAAEHAERLAGIGRLVAGVVHELNNPLTAVNMYSEVLLEKLGGAGHDPGDVEKLRAIRESGLRIQRLARDLVAYARPTGARIEPVDLAAVLDEAARLAKPALKETSAVLERAFEEAPPVEASRPSLVQVFVNLVTNAAQAVSPGGRVTLRLGASDGAVRVVVEDDGAGMEPEVEKHAFEPFFTTRPGQGIGLGLPIVQGIVERHGGTVALETSPGRGTRVAVTLPVKRPG